MNNILVDALPTSLEIDGMAYPIDTDFKSNLQIILAFEDPDLTPQEKVSVLLANLYLVPPPNWKVAAEKANWFLNAGDDEDREEGPRLYSFSKDANLIFAAFRQTHGIDLTIAQLHWWQFMALFMDLGQDTMFCQLTSLRKRIKTGKATKEERQLAKELGATFDLPEMDTRTLEQKDRLAEFLRLVDEGKKRKEQERKNANPDV